MFALSHKSKKKLLLALKLFILTITFWYVYLKLTHNNAINFNDFSNRFYNNNIIFSILGFLLLAAANWFLEILKWKTIVSEIQNISFLTAMKQSLASLTVSLATPNRIGEYGAKAYFFEKAKRKNILLLNFFHNSFQMTVTVVFGVLGLWFVLNEYELPISFSKLVFGIFTLGFFVLLGFLLKKQPLVLKGLTISKVILKFKNISITIRGKLVLFSVLRYFIFCYLFYSLLVFFGVSISLVQAIPLIFSMYLLVSIVPTIFIFDVVVRGGVAVWLFSLAGVSELSVLSTVLSMWLLNFVIPSLFGSYYLLTYQPESA